MLACHEDFETNKHVEVYVDQIVKELQEADDGDLNSADGSKKVNLETTNTAEMHDTSASRTVAWKVPRTRNHHLKLHVVFQIL